MPRLDRSSPAYLEALRSSVRWDFTRDEPYVQLPSFPDIRIVPYAEGMQEGLMHIFNQPAVTARLFSVPVPFTGEFADHRVKTLGAAQRQLSSSLVKPARPDHGLSTETDPSHPQSPANSAPLPPQPGPVLGCPFKAIVRVLLDGTRENVGDCILAPGSVLLPSDSGLARSRIKRPDELGAQAFKIPVIPGPSSSSGPDSGSSAERGLPTSHQDDADGAYELLVEVTEDESATYPPELQAWHLGYVLDGAWEGRGIMSEVVGCLTQGWAGGFLGSRMVMAFAELSNAGSARVLERNGFELVGVEHTPWPENKGGGVRDCGCYVLRLGMPLPKP